MEQFAYRNFMSLPLEKSTVDFEKMVRSMKIVSILLLVCCLQVWAGGKAQSITLTVRDAPLKQVFKSIEKQSNYSFVYAEKILAFAKPVTFKVSQANIREVLEECFKNQELTYSMDGMQVIVSLSLKPSNGNSKNILQNQLIDIAGKIVNEEGIGVVVSVMIKGTRIVVTTNEKGEFVLKGVEENAVLVITGVGIENLEWKVINNATPVIIVKTKIVDTEEVVINTGYQNLPRERATGSFALIDNNAINQQVGTNILDRINGMSAGVLFDSKETTPQKKHGFTIRGLSSINGPIDPLIIIDNFPYEGDINNINPNDIESISILKDAAATSIYGARGGNGVVIINMKQSAFNQPVKIDFNTNFILSNKPDLKYLPAISSADYIDVEQTLFNNGYFNDYITFDWFYHYPFSPAVQTFSNRRNGIISAQDSATNVSRLKNIDSRDQIKDLFYSKSTNQQYALNFRGGGDKNKYIFSIGYDKTSGQRFDHSNRLNIRMQNSFKPTEKLRIDVGAYYTVTKGTSGAITNFKLGNKEVPYLSFLDDAGNPLSMPVVHNDVFTDTVGRGYLLDWKYYPVEDWKHSTNTIKGSDLIANFGATYQIFKSLEIDLKYQYQLQKTDGENHFDLESYYARDLINRFSQINYTNGSVKHIIPVGGILDVSSSVVNSHNIRAQLNYHTRWRDHQVIALAGIEVRQVKRTSSSHSLHGYSASPLSYADVDFVNQYPDFVSGSLNGISGSPQRNRYTNNFISTYFNSSYAFRNRYVLNASLRKDGSNIFGVTTNDKWKPLWSTGVAWELHKEAFYNLKWLPTIKPRLTYGFSGNVDLSRSALPIAGYVTDPITNMPVSQIGILNNPSLRWEKVKIFNMGMDFSVKKNYIYGSIEYYVKNGMDLYGGAFYDYTTWGYLPYITKNVAGMKGKGWDITLHSINIDKTFKWTTSLFFNSNNSKITQYFTADAEQTSRLLGSGNAISPVIGKPLYAIAAYKWGGLNGSGNPQGFVNGELSTDYVAIRNEANSKGEDGNIRFVGSALPTSFGNLVNTFSWRGFSLSANISYKFGYYFKRPSLSYYSLIELGVGHSEFENRWQKPGDEMHTNVPAFYYPNDQRRDAFYNNADINVLKGDHIRLQYINIAYSLNNSIAKKIKASDLQLYANASNLGILWRANNEKIDPESPVSIPPLKSFAVGLRTSFYCDPDLYERINPIYFFEQQSIFYY